MKFGRFLSSLFVCCVALMLTTLFVSTAFASNNPVPQVVGPPVPQAVVPGSGAFTLKVYGANFVQGAVVNWNRSPRTTTFVSARELHAQILASDIEKPTAGHITVTNPPPGGGVSSSSYTLVEVHTPTSTISVGPPHVYLRDIGAELSILSDFNNDGILDFAADYGASEVKVMLGNGDGTFGHGSILWGYAGSDVAAIAAGDFNNDGNEDLVYGTNPYGPPFHLAMHLGNGDGTFRRGAQFGRFQSIPPIEIAVGDFNRDGNLDLATVPGTSANLGIFVGNGDGTFRELVDYQQGGGFPLLADVNGDGILDIVSFGIGFHSVAVMLGNGDGTFQKARTVVSSKMQIGDCGFGLQIVVTDFNADGKADLAYCERDIQANRGKIWVALGNGDGTFQKPVSLVLSAYQGAVSFTVGDFNSDGKTDILANYYLANNFNKTETDLFLGNGDGTFQQKKIIHLPGEPYYNAELGFALDDFNSDGLLDFIVKQPGEFAVFVQK